jgi:hypothetical protein
MTQALATTNGHPKSPRQFAGEYADAGLVTHPLRTDGTKAAIAKGWQTRKVSTPEQLDADFNGRELGIGIVGGPESGNLEILDFERLSVFERFVEVLKTLAPGLLDKLPRVQTPGKHDEPGMHVYYRCAAIQGSQKLARRLKVDEKGQPILKDNGEPDTEEVIETRGRAAYVVAPGSPARCHQKNRPYFHVAGPPITQTPTIEPWDRDTLLNTARTFDEPGDAPAPATGNPAPTRPRDVGDALSPGDDFGRRATWGEILEPHGWQRIHERQDGLAYWRRPGKEDPGWSATTGMTSKSDGRELICVFSTSTPFQIPLGRTCACHDKFGVYTVLNHGGDFEKAAKELASRGFGSAARDGTAHSANVAADPRPTVLVTGALMNTTQQAWDAILASNDPPRLFRHGTMPCRIEADDEGNPVVRPLNVDRTKHTLARVARCVRTSKGKDGQAIEVEIEPPDSLVRDILATPDMPLPVLNRIVQAPVFGHHAGSRAYYSPRPGFKVPTVSAQPSEAEIDEAVSLIRDDLLVDFPFTGDPERANAIALMLLPFARELIDGATPLHLFEKPCPGTGATLLVDMLTFPATGMPVAVMAEGSSEDEWRKRMTAKVRTAPTFILIDNIRQRLDSAVVSSAITAPVWEDRILGISQNISLPIRSGWIATGNNPVVSSEIARRTIRIRLDAKTDRPWLRETFKHADLRGWVAENRGRLVWAALTLIQAWLAAGRPAGGRKLGMFEAWSEVMGGILDVAGLPGFLGNLEAFYDESDAEGEAWRAFVADWWAEHQELETQTKDLLALAGSLDLGDREHSQKIRLGKLLSDMRDRMFTIPWSKATVTVRLERGGERRRAQLWRLKFVAEATADAA